MKENLVLLQSHTCKIPTKAHWFLGANERSHAFLQKAVERLLLHSEYKPGPKLSVLFSDVRMAWNLTLHTNKILPHYRGFGVMTRVLSELQTPSRLFDRQHLILLAKKAPSQSRADDIIRRVNKFHRRNITTSSHFNIN